MISKAEAQRRKELHICRSCKEPCSPNGRGEYFALCDIHRAKYRSYKYAARHQDYDYCRQCGAKLLPTEDICKKCGRDINLDIDWSK